MLEVRVDKFETHYRLPVISPAERQRLDQVRALVLNDTLETALEDAGVPQDAEVCIRSVTALVHLRLNGSEQALALDWGQALAAEVMRSLRVGPTPNVVVYHSSRHALMDMTICVSRFDLARVWAWRQLSLWRQRDVVDRRAAVSEVVREICAEPNNIVPTLLALADAGTLNGIVDFLSEHQWEEIASAALSKAAAVDHVLDETSDAPSARAIRDANRVLIGSHLLRATTSSNKLFGESDLVRRAVAALAVLDVEPTLLRTKHAHLVVEIIARAIKSRSVDSIASALPANPVDEISDVVHTREGLLERVTDHVVDENEEESKPVDLRKQGHTRFGGLLFLIALLDELELPGEILAHDVLGSRPFQWIVHQLALSLVDVETNDPAVLAFCGLAPDAVPPSHGQSIASEIETQVIRGFASRIVDRLESIIEIESNLQTNVLDFVCRRSAVVVAEPGWIDLNFSIDDVSTELRRAGLDLNPGYISWLGIVMRFGYE